MSPKMLFIGLGAVVLLGGAWLGLNGYASSKAEQAVAESLRNADLGNIVSYDGVSHNVLSGTTTISDVRVSGNATGGKAVSIAKVKISSLRLDGEYLEAADVRFSGTSIPLLEIARACLHESCSFQGAIRNLIRLGYRKVDGDIFISMTSGSDDRTLSLTANADLPAIGKLDVSAALQRLDIRKLEDTVKAARKLTSSSRGKGLEALFMIPQVMKDATQSIIGTELTDLQIELIDKGLRSRQYKIFQAESYDLSEPADFVEKTADTAARTFGRQLEEAGQGRSKADNASRELHDFLAKGGALKITTDISHPVRLFEEGGFFGIYLSRDAETLGALMTATEAELEHS